MKYRAFLVAILSGLHFGCATTHSENVAKSISKDTPIPLKMSAKSIDLNSKEPFQLVEVTIENLTTEWLRIHKAEVVVGDPSESQLSVVMGSDLVDWAKAMHFKKSLEEHNQQVMHASLLAAGTAALAVGSLNNNPGSDASVAAVSGGKALVIGGSVWAISDTINHSYRAATESVKLPENHLYTPVSIPGGMFMRRWVLFNKPPYSSIDTLVLKIETVEGAKDRYEIHF